MTEKICFIIIVFIAFVVMNAVSYKRGKSAEKVKQLKEEIKRRAQEQRAANEKVDFVRNLNKSDIDNRLRKLAEDQQRNNL